MAKSSSNKREFEVFKREFQKRQQQFGLNDYQVYFEHKKLEGDFACININEHEKVASVFLDNSRHPDRDAKKSAKHEAIHLLVSKLQYCAYSRYISENEVDEATEGLVVKLQGLIE